MIANTEPRKLSELLRICLHHATTISTGLSYGMCIVAEDLKILQTISLEEEKIVKDNCMKLVHETQLEGGHMPVHFLRTALFQRLQGNHIYVDDLCYLIYSCWIDKLESEGK